MRNTAVWKLCVSCVIRNPGRARIESLEVHCQEHMGGQLAKPASSELERDVGICEPKRSDQLETVELESATARAGASGSRYGIRQ